MYIVHGSGFRPSTTITVQLIGEGVPPDHLITSPDHPVTDMRGIFNYAVDQGHRFFSGPIPAGVYRVLASAPGEGSASAAFRINLPGSGGPPPVP